MSLKALLIAYLFGGVTFIPLVVCSLLYYLYTTLPEVDADGNVIPKDAAIANVEEDEKKKLELQEQEDEKRKAEDILKALENQTEIGVDAYMTGWLTVSREFSLLRTSSTTEKATSLNETAYTSIYKHLIDRKQSVAAASQSPPESKAKPKPRKKQPNTYFAILRHGNLFLYDSPELMNVQQAIVIAHYNVTLWPPDVPDGQLFIRRHAICLGPKRGRSHTDDLEPATGPPKNAYFLFSENCSEKEDFYFALLRAAKRRRLSNGSTTSSKPGISPFPDPLIDAHPLQFEQEDAIQVIQTLHSSDAHMQSMWLNALLGRMFLALHNTEVFERFIKNKIDTKLSRVKRPSFLGDITVTKVHCGTSPPYFTNPKMNDFTPDGNMTVSADLTYTGDFKIEIATKATLNFGSRFKTREVSLVLSVAFKSLEGRINFTIKPPPSNRIWYCFETMPKISMTIDPVVSSRQIKYSMVTRVIENRINDALRDSLVAPFMDDLAFYDTRKDFFRGGIWDRKLRQSQTQEADELSAAAAIAENTDQQIETHFQHEMQHHEDNISISSAISSESDRQSVFDDAASVMSHEMRHRKLDMFAGDEDNSRRKRGSGALTGSAPAIVATDRVNIVVVDGKVVSHKDTSVSQYTSASTSSPLNRTPSRSSGRSSFSRGDAELFRAGVSHSATSSVENVSMDDSQSIASLDTARDSDHVRSDSASGRSFMLSSSPDYGEERSTLSESVKKWGNKYFASAKKTVSSRIASPGMSSSNPVVLREDQIQKKIIEARLAHSDDSLHNAPRPHTYPPDYNGPAGAESPQQSAEELTEGPSVFVGSPSPSYATGATKESYGPTSMHVPGSVSARPSPVPPARKQVPNRAAATGEVETATPSTDSPSQGPPALPPRIFTPPSAMAPDVAETVPPASTSQLPPSLPPRLFTPPPATDVQSAELSSPVSPESPSRPASVYDLNRSQTFARRKPVPAVRPAADSAEDGILHTSMPTNNLASGTLASSSASTSSGTPTERAASPELMDFEPVPMPLPARDPEAVPSDEVQHGSGELADTEPSADEPKEAPQVRNPPPLPPRRTPTMNKSPPLPPRRKTATQVAPASMEADSFDIPPPISFVDLVDEGNSFGLGSYDFTATHHSFGSSPSYSSSGGSASWMEKARGRKGTASAESESVDASPERVESSKDRTPTMEADEGVFQSDIVTPARAQDSAQAGGE